MRDAAAILTPQQRGRAAEEASASFLSSQGYEILRRNVRLRIGEIDMIARESGYLVFLEIRSRRHEGLGLPQETVSHRKQARLRRLARLYLAMEKNPDCLCRFDVVGVIIGLYGDVRSIELIKDAF